jgi:hypothetical protein
MFFGYSFDICCTTQAVLQRDVVAKALNLRVQIVRN